MTAFLKTTTTLILVTLIGLLVINCGGSSGGGTPNADGVTAQLTLNFPDGSSATAARMVDGRVAGLPEAVTDITLVAVSNTTFQVQENTVSLATLTTTLPITAADFDFYVIVDGTPGYVAASSGTLTSGADSIDVAFSLNEGSPPVVTSTSISEVAAREALLRTVTINQKYSVPAGLTLAISATFESLPEGTDVDGINDKYGGNVVSSTIFPANTASITWSAPSVEGVYVVYMTVKTPNGSITLVRAEITVTEALTPECDCGADSQITVTNEGKDGCPWTSAQMGCKSFLDAVIGSPGEVFEEGTDALVDNCEIVLSCS